MSSKSVSCVIFDWAGTTVDYGCFAPLHAFVSIFEKRGIFLSPEEARGPMGLPKLDHVRVLTRLPRIADAWFQRFDRFPNERDVLELYADFEPALFEGLSDHTDPIPGVIETVADLRERGAKIGSTTGYTRAMMNVVAPPAAAKGYAPDCLFTPSEVAGGRPAPWMIYRCCETLKVWPLSSVIKVGDTLSDIAEGLNASVTTVGVILGSNELGLTQTEVDTLPSDELQRRMDTVRERYLAAGAHHVIDSISDLIPLTSNL